MATNEMKYEYELVEAGDTSPNNTIIEIADKHSMSKDILIRLNPYLLVTGILHNAEKDVAISYKKSDGKTYKYTIPAGVYKYSLLDVSKEIGVDTKTLIDSNKTLLSENCCFPPAYNVLRTVGSMTDNVNAFIEEWYVVEKDNVSLNGIATEKKIELATLMKLNPNISQNDTIPKQAIVLLSVKSPSDGTSVEITEFGLQADTSRTLFVKWRWDEEYNKTQNYEVKWSYMTSDGQWWVGNESTTKDGTVKVATYNVDELGVAAKVSIRPVAKSGILSSNKFAWSSEMIYNFGKSMVTTPPTPKVEIKKYKLTATIEDFSIPNNQNFIVNNTLLNNTLNKIAKSKKVDIDKLVRLNPSYGKDEELPLGTVIILSVDPVYVEFEIVRDHNSVFNNSGLVQVLTGYVSYSCTIEAGSNYKVRCRSYVNGLYSAWSAYSGAENAMPVEPYITSVEPTSENDVRITWTKINSAERYSIEYVKKDIITYKDLPKEQYFDNPNVQTTTISDIPAETVNEATVGFVSYSIYGLETGYEYFVRVNAANDQAAENSKWSNIETFIIGTESDAPTTWSSANVGVVGDSLPVKLYWIHNSKDGSIESRANLKLIANGVEVIHNIIKSTDPEERLKTSFFELDMDNYPAGSEIKWSVQTAGVYTDKSNGWLVYGKWSIERTVNIYAPPTLSLNLLDYQYTPLEKILNAYCIQSFPFRVSLRTGNNSNQKPTGYYISIIANQDYTTVDETGSDKIVVKGTKVYTAYQDVDVTETDFYISANDVNLVNNMEYIIEATVAMSSGLTATSMAYAKVRWTVTEAIPAAEVLVDKDTLTASIYPYVPAAREEVLLSVYRREFDGSFTEIETEIPNSNNSVVIDPHPALDYARYRIVATNQTTGAISYNDVPGTPVQEKAIVIQWDERWNSFDVNDTDKPEQPSYSGNILMLPYNIDISNAHTKDSSTVKYAGRKRPVSYYGTQLGESATWNTVIPHYDVETLYAIRRLAIWMGDVYVREPSGVGYWAHINVSYSQTHMGLTIPITFNVTPVEGGK